MDTTKAMADQLATSGFNNAVERMLYAAAERGEDTFPWRNLLGGGEELKVQPMINICEAIASINAEGAERCFIWLIEEYFLMGHLPTAEQRQGLENILARRLQCGTVGAKTVIEITDVVQTLEQSAFNKLFVDKSREIMGRVIKRETETDWNAKARWMLDTADVAMGGFWGAHDE